MSQTLGVLSAKPLRSKFHWHVEDNGIRHHYIKPGTPRLNGKVERSHKTGKQEFYQLLEYTDDVDLNKKLKEWEILYNCHRPQGAFKGKTPYEILKKNAELKSCGLVENAKHFLTGPTAKLSTDFTALTYFHRTEGFTR